MIPRCHFSEPKRINSRYFFLSSFLKQKYVSLLNSQVNALIFHKRIFAKFLFKYFANINFRELAFQRFRDHFFSRIGPKFAKINLLYQLYLHSFLQKQFILSWHSFLQKQFILSRGCVDVISESEHGNRTTVSFPKRNFTNKNRHSKDLVSNEFPYTLRELIFANFASFC